MVNGILSPKATDDANFARAFEQAISAVHGGWTVLPVTVGVNGKPQGGLCRADRGIALVGNEINPDAVPEAKQVLIAAGFEKRFGSLPPILYRPLPPLELSLEEVLEAAFDLEPPLEVVDPEAWLQAVRDAFIGKLVARPGSKNDGHQRHDVVPEVAPLSYPVSQAPRTTINPHHTVSPAVAVAQFASHGSPPLTPDAAPPRASSPVGEKTARSEPSAETAISTIPTRKPVPAAVLLGSTLTLIILAGLGWALVSRFDVIDPLGRMVGLGTGPPSGSSAVEGSRPLTPNHPPPGWSGQGTSQGHSTSSTQASVGPRASPGLGHDPEGGEAMDRPPEAPPRSSPAIGSPDARWLPEDHAPAHGPQPDAQSAAANPTTMSATSQDGSSRADAETPHQATPASAPDLPGRTAPERRQGESVTDQPDSISPELRNLPAATAADANGSVAPPPVNHVEASSLPSATDALAARPEASSGDGPALPFAPSPSDTAASPAPRSAEGEPSEGSVPALSPGASTVETSLPPARTPQPPGLGLQADDANRIQAAPQSPVAAIAEPDPQRPPEPAIRPAPAPLQPSPSLATELLPSPTDRAPSAPAPRSISPDMLANLMRRGHAMRDAGDVSAARLLFRRAAEAGSAAAATALGKTYDPDSLNGTGARTIGADRTAAMHWYEQGAMRGDLEASRLLKQLNERTPSP